MGRIGIEGMEFFAYHGNYKFERTEGGKYQVDVYVKIDFDKAAEKDELSGTIDYEGIYKICSAEMEIPANLIENVAWRIKEKICHSFDQIQKLKVRVTKLNPPIQGETQRVYAEIKYKRNH
jgi:7,8-dihydroneopterin aldolase/epimerase/oxygenase